MADPDDADPAATDAPTPSRTPPWGIVLGAVAIAAFCYWVYGLIVTPIPPPPKLMGTAPRGVILGLDDSATRRRDAELDAPQPKLTAPPPSASTVVSATASARASASVSSGTVEDAPKK